MFRLALRSIRPYPSHIPLGSLQHTFNLVRRGYASENNNLNPKVVDLIYKMQTTPSVVNALKRVEDLVKAKGLNEKSGFGQFTAIMKDKELEEALRQVIYEMDKAGIKISPEVIEPILKSMAKK